VSWPRILDRKKLDLPQGSRWPAGHCDRGWKAAEGKRGKNLDIDKLDEGEDLYRPVWEELWPATKTGNWKEDWSSFPLAGEEPAHQPTLEPTE
jgi:hypothetical protein